MRLDSPTASQVFVAEIDSGAACSVFPIAVAALLKIGIDDLVEDAPGRGADGTEFPMWRCIPEVWAQVIRVADDGAYHPWGPTFELEPSFAYSDDLLLGRHDFFTHFQIIFGTDDAAGPWFAIED